MAHRGKKGNPEHADSMGGRTQEGIRRAEGNPQNYRPYPKCGTIERNRRDKKKTSGCSLTTEA
eukprot:51723-Prorocentrum_lima.AAC.1